MKILNDNVHAIVSGKIGALAVTGLAHLGLDYGKLYLINVAGSATKATFLEDLGSAPHVIAEKPDDPASILVVTGKALLEVSPGGSVGIIHLADLSGLYPNSIVAGGDGVIYVGMRFFVLQLIPAAGGYQEQWLVPVRCRKTCVCKSGK